MSDQEKDLLWLLQRELRDRVLPRIGKDSWQVIGDHHDGSDGHGGIYCALIHKDKVPFALGRVSWDLHKGGGLPGFSMSFEEGSKVISYQRFSGTEGIEPFLFYREFDGIRPSYVEVSEEFRHYHNLFWEPRRGELLKIADDGNEEAVVRLTGKRVEVRMKELREFMAARQLCFAIYFDFVRFSAMDSSMIGSSDKQVEFSDQSLHYNFSVSDWDRPTSHRRSFSRLVGKKLLLAPPIQACGAWPFDEEQSNYESFIIGTDDQGAPTEYTCDPEELANYFGANPNAPHYLTPVYFRREVLAKYYSQPSKYKVEDGLLRCASLWSLRIDNHHEDYVVVFLGDLGGLAKSERLYWKSYNVVPEGGVSEVAFRRGFLAEWTEPRRTDLVFRMLYRNVCLLWEERRQWSLFRDLDEEDEHLFSSLRIPLADDQSEFDVQILALTKVLVDSLNEECLSDYVGALSGEKGLTKLEKFLQGIDSSEATFHMGFLRALQALRSSGVAHRKGSKYKQVAQLFGLGQRDRRDIFEEILQRAVSFLKFLERIA